MRTRFDTIFCMYEQGMAALEKRLKETLKSFTDWAQTATNQIELYEKDICLLVCQALCRAIC